MSNAVRVEELRQEFAECRGDLRHSWDRLPITDWEKGPLDSPGRGAYWSLARCTRCTTKRLALISEDTGDVLKRDYDYPEGYRLDEKVTIAELRVMFRQRETRRQRRNDTRKK